VFFLLLSDKQERKTEDFLLPFCLACCCVELQDKISLRYRDFFFHLNNPIIDSFSQTRNKPAKYSFIKVLYFVTLAKKSANLDFQLTGEGDETCLSC
jgi:hypothetical protein